jgi:Leucine-rich repeat (LRR) protein
MLSRILPVILVFTGALLAACSTYDLTVNDKRVYTPKPLFADYAIDDSALAACVDQAITSYKANSASQVGTLDCTDAGIESLNGLATFTALNEVKLAGNNISDISQLAAASAVQVLHLSNNQIVDPVPLYKLTALRVLDLSGNDQLHCPSPTALIRVESLTLPRHCRQ